MTALFGPFEVKTNGLNLLHIKKYLGNCVKDQKFPRLQHRSVEH